ncbi:MAG: hypothetical protein ACI35O_02325 [Bacillaceae bacterium]
MYKRWLYIGVLVVVVGFVLFIYDAFNGNPISKYAAKKQVETYLEETYSDKEFVIKDVFYDFKFGQYNFRVTPIGEEETYIIAVRPFMNKDIDDMYESSLIDETLSERLSQEGEKELTAYVKKVYPEVELVSPYISVKKGELASDMTFSKEVLEKFGGHIELATNASKQTEQQFLEMIRSIKQLLDDSDYTYTDVNVNGRVDVKDAAKDGGMVIYGTGFDKQTKLDDIKLTYSEKINKKQVSMWTAQKSIFTILLIGAGIAAIYFLVRGFWKRKNR